MPLKIVLVAPFFLLIACSSSAPPGGSNAEKRAQVPAPEPVRITQLYSAPASPGKGEKTLLCYGVENATEVRIDPPVERLWPSQSRCFDIPSSKTATYTLTATRGGESVSKSLTVAIGPPAVKILEVSINKLNFAPGDEVTVCYKVRNAKQVTLRPGTKFGPQTPQLGCISDHPKKTTTYTVTATGAGDSVDTEHVTATIQ